MAAINGLASIKIRDGQGLVSSTSQHLTTDDGVSLSEIAAWVNVWGTLVNAVTIGTIVELSFTLIPTVTVTPNAGTNSNVSDSLVLSFPVAGATTRSDFVVPALSQSLKLGGKPVMTEGGAIDLLADYMEAPFLIHAAADSVFTDRQHLDYAAVARGALSFRKPGRQLNKSKTPGV